VFLVGLVSDLKYSHFKPVLDVYIEETFSATLAYKYVRLSIITDKRLTCLEIVTPMIRYAPALGSHFCQTLSAAVVCPSLDISTELTPDKIITELSRPALRAHLTTGDGGLVVQSNPGSEPWRLTCNL